MNAAIYGAGGNGLRFYEVMKQADIAIDFFIDQYTDREEVDGIPVRRLTQVDQKQIPTFVSVASYSGRIAEQLRQSGFNQVFDFNQSVSRIPGLVQAYVPSMPWFSPDWPTLASCQGLQELRKLLATDQDRKLLDQIVRFRSEPTAAHYIPNDGLTQYFPEDLNPLPSAGELRWLDGGAFTGDTFQVAHRYSLEQKLPFTFAALYEPDPANLLQIRQTLDSCTPPVQTAVFPCGLWSEACILAFQTNSSAGSVIRPGQTPPDGSVNIPAVTIDQTVYHMKPNYIKMDIEGAESQAIQGAQHTIANHRPSLAICLYHNASDLWELPLAVKEIRKDYRLHLRVHGDMG